MQDPYGEKMASDIRNIAFVGHPSSGKTSLVDSLAFLTGVVPRKGTVADKTSICDTEPEEQDKGHTLFLSSVYAEHSGKRWTFLDTPGYPDFIAHSLGAMFAADLVVGVVSCTTGVSFNLRTKMKRAAEMGRGRAIVLTHLDADNVDFDEIVEELRSAIGEVCVPVRLPNQSGPGFSEVIRTIGSDSPWRQRLLDRVMDACEDEELLDSYLETQEVSLDILEELMPAAIALGSIVPILVCNPTTDLGVEELLYFCEHYAPSPENIIFKDGDGSVIPFTKEGALLGVVFNVKTDPHVGRISLARILHGKLDAGAALSGSAHSEDSEKPGGLFHLVGGKKREAVDSAQAGDIIAFSKVEDIGFGDAFTDHKDEAHPIQFVKLPAPMVAVAIEPKTRADEQKIGEALHKIAAEDPTFTVGHQDDINQFVGHGMSDLHLQVIAATIKRRFGVEMTMEIPRIAYRETITKSAEAHYRHKKQSGGKGQFGECYIRIKPVNNGDDVVFTDKVVGGAIPRNLIPAVEKGIREQASHGVSIQSKVVGVEVELYDGKFHAVDSDEASFKAAGSRAFREGVMAAGPVLLEPTVELEIHIPTSDAGAIFSDITSHRRGQVLDQESEGDGAVTIIKAVTPLATVQTYNRDLKSQTSGEGTYTMKPVGYARVPASEQKKVLVELAKQHED